MSIPNCYTAFNLLKKYRAYTSQLFQIHNVTLRSGGVTVAAVFWLLAVLRNLVLAVVLVAAFSLVALSQFSVLGLGAGSWFFLNSGSRLFSR